MCEQCQNPFLWTREPGKGGPQPRFCADCARQRRLGRKRQDNYNRRGQRPSPLCSDCGVAPVAPKTTPGGRPRTLCVECRETHRENDKVVNAEWRRANPERHARTKRRTNLKRRGLTPELFDALLASQGGCCAGCGSDDPKGANWHVDHDHNCCGPKRACFKCIRGLLCNACNPYLGWLKDDPGVAAEKATDHRHRAQHLDTLAAYLRRPRPITPGGRVKRLPRLSHTQKTPSSTLGSASKKKQTA